MIFKEEPRVYRIAIKHHEVYQEIYDFLERTKIHERVEIKTEILMEMTTTYVIHFKDIKDTFMFDITFADKIKQVYENYG